MAWPKVPAAHDPLFRKALPKGATTRNMVGCVVGLVNDKMFGWLFGNTMVVKLSPDDQPEAFALDGAQPFDPMGRGARMRDAVQLPDSVMDDPHEMKVWLKRAYDYVATLPAKKTKSKKKSGKPQKPRRNTRKQ
jgi:TfoX/Sxy family transcriptional regulator of competence genes